MLQEEVANSPSWQQEGIISIIAQKALPPLPPGEKQEVPFHTHLYKNIQSRIIPKILKLETYMSIT